MISFSWKTPSNQPARWVRKITLVVNSEKPINDRKKMTSRESSTPFWKPSKCVITLKEAIVSTIHGLAQLSNKLMTGGKPARIKNRQTTTETIKLTTCVRVIAEVMQLMARYAPAINQLPI